MYAQRMCACASAVFLHIALGVIEIQTTEKYIRFMERVRGVLYTIRRAMNDTLYMHVHINSMAVYLAGVCLRVCVCVRAFVLICIIITGTSSLFRLIVNYQQYYTQHIPCEIYSCFVLLYFICTLHITVENNFIRMLCTVSYSPL